MIPTHPDQIARRRAQERDAPMFRSTGQALWVAYVMEYARPSPKTPLMDLIKAVNNGNYTEEVSLSRANLFGLSDEEQRIQGVYIREQAEKYTNDLERHWIWAKYSWTEDKKTGLLYLSRWLIDELPPRDRLYPGMIVRRIYGPVSMQWQASPRKIHGKFGVPGRTVERDLERANELFSSIRQSAFSKLDRFFRKNGII